MDRIRTAAQSRKKKTMKTSYIHDESFRSRSAHSPSPEYTALVKLADATARNAAHRFARYTLSGLNPSHIADATADAVGEFAAKFPTTCLSPRVWTGARRKAAGRFLRRAAVRSLRGIMRQGVRGDDTLGTPAFTTLDVIGAFHATRPDWLPGEICPIARKAAVKLVWQLSRITAAHHTSTRSQLWQKREGSRRRFRVCVRLIAGATMTDAIAGEYASPNRWYTHMRKSGLLAKLEPIWPGVTASLRGIKSHSYNLRHA